MNSDTNNTVKKPRPRPLSPHLQVYSWLITSTTSILHRLTGMALVLGSLLLVTWLAITAFMPEQYECFSNFCASPVGMIILVGFTWAFFYHLSNGIRHLIWDMGRGFAVATVNVTGPIVIASSIILTAITWAFIL